MEHQRYEALLVDSDQTLKYDNNSVKYKHVNLYITVTGEALLKNYPRRFLNILTVNKPLMCCNLHQVKTTSVEKPLINGEGCVGLVSPGCGCSCFHLKGTIEFDVNNHVR